MGERWARFFLHRTGHDLGTELHGAGANLDDYETHEPAPSRWGFA